VVVTTAGELVRRTRRRHGLTQRQLAIRARTSQAAISRIERDVVSPTVATLGELLRLMNEELALEAREIDWGHDRTLNQRRLALEPEDRVRRQAEWARAIGRIRHAATT
jgi:transcriptional regulator with XRE-family HTH domain